MDTEISGTAESETPAIKAFRAAIRTGRSRSYFYVTLLGIHQEDPMAIFKSVERGISFKAFEQFQRNTQFSTRDLANVVAIKSRTLHRRKEEGRLGPEESDRLVRFTRIFAKALELFEGNLDAARQWLSTPMHELGGKRPLALVKTDVGAREVEALIGRIEHGVIA